MPTNHTHDLPAMLDDAERRAFHELCEALFTFLVAHEHARERRGTARQATRPANDMNVAVGTERNRPAPNPESLLISTRQAAKMLGLCERTVSALSQPHGPIPVVRIGRCVRYSPDDLKTFIQNRKSKADRKADNAD
jgi:hypothetical protein